jgi:putative ABC transport system permease protein
MFWNYLKIALRNLRKYKLYAAINILGLALGLTIYLFGSLLIDYEESHDEFYANSDRIYTLGAHVSPNLEVGIRQMNSVFSAVGPIVEAELTDVDAVARTLYYEYLVRLGAESVYQTTWFADPALLQIFDFDYVHGDASALDDPTGVIITEAAAIRYFGSTAVMGETITLDNQHDFYVSAVIRDIPRNSHFNSLPIMDQSIEVLGSINALPRLRDFDVAGIWDNWSMGRMTYVLLPDALDQDWLQSQMDSIYDRHVPDEIKEQTISGFFVNPLNEANLALWDALGLPVIAVVSLLSFLVLVVACVNYTNLATAQSLGRSREVGMRKTMGAGTRQLLVQFLVESLVIAAIAMIVAVAALEVLIPLFNNAANKVMTLDYLRSLPWLLATTFVVGLIAGAYPAWLITRTSPIDALRDIARKGKKGSKVRAFMIGGQFAISAFMLALVVIVFAQNKLIRESSNIFPRSEIYGLLRIEKEDIQERLDTLQNELEALPAVESVAFSSQVPYEQNNSTSTVSNTPGDEAGAYRLQIMRASPEFLDVYDIPLLAGRNLDRNIANDTLIYGERETINILVNELALEYIGVSTPEEAINKRIYNTEDEDTLREMVIVGVVPTQNIVGFFQSEKPWVFWHAPESFRVGSIRVTQGDVIDIVDDVEAVWNRVYPEYPMQGRFLDDIFNDVYSIMRYMNLALAIFAGVALTLALIGLFGLAAFMAAQRTREIGVRKVLGASSAQIARLLVWQFSKPVIWGLGVALPLAFAAASLYLNFFGERIGSPVPNLILAGVAAVVLAWATVAGHVYRIARADPVLALRYE